MMDSAEGPWSGGVHAHGAGTLLATSGGARRGVTVGFVGTASLGRRLLQVAERMGPSIRLVSAVSEKAHGAREKAMQIAGEVEVILFSGPLPYDLATAAGQLPVPAVYVPPGGPALPTVLLRAALLRDVELDRLSIDSVSENEVRDTYEELDQGAAGVHVMEYQQSATTEDFLHFHGELFRAGRTTAAITTLPVVAQDLAAEGIPVLVMRPDATTLRTALNTALLVGGGASLDKERMAMVIVRVPKALTPQRHGITNSTFTELRLQMMREVLHEARRMDALVLPRDDVSFLVCVSMGSLRAATHDLAAVPFVARIREALDFEPDIGIGVGRTVVEAEVNAEEAADSGSETEERSVFMVGPNESIVQIPRDHAGGVPVALAGQEPREAEILRQILKALAHVGEESRIVQAEQVADLLGVTLRTARRHLRNLVEADLAWQLPPIQTSKVGRPPIPYRLLEQRLQA